ncbi:MAG: DUF2194 domain-containing protein [Ruminococcus sp.]|nr:DUF2194 domain-containing protein [Ruminococcus sp.]
MIITRRLFFITIVIFLTLLLLFMGFQVGKEVVSDSGLNKHTVSVASKGKGKAAVSEFIKVNKKGKPDGLSNEDNYALYLGDENSEYADTVREWSYYTKVPVAAAKKLPARSVTDLPDILMIEPEFVSGRSQRIAELMDKGVDVVFLSLPSYSYVETDSVLREILGIYKLIQEKVELRGVHLFKGFLLGGERIFEEDTESDSYDESENRQDLELSIPWYSVRTRTKTYMRGTLSDKDLKMAEAYKYKNEDFPAIVWRSCYGKGEAYAVNGEYLKNRRVGIGMLQAMMYERKEYFVYPVINAQVFSVESFPILTDENQDQVKKVYGRSITKAQTDIMLPMFISLASNFEKKPSFFLSVKYNLNDKASPHKDILKTYLSMIDDTDGELALSANHRGDYSNKEFSADLKFLSSEAPDYNITAVIGSSDGLSKLSDALVEKDVHTVATSKYTPDMPVVGYLGDNITFQQATSDLKRHTFTDELELLGVYTVLAYSNSCYNMSDAFYPRTQKDEWQNSSRKVFSNLTTYSDPFRAVDSLTVTESDERIRNYLKIEYSVERSGDVVTIKSEGGSRGPVRRFILRTHDERIKSVNGGESKKLEDNAYLISAERPRVEIKLSSVLSELVEMKGSNR